MSLSNLRRLEKRLGLLEQGRTSGALTEREYELLKPAVQNEYDAEEARLGAAIECTLLALADDSHSPVFGSRSGWGDK